MILILNCVQYTYMKILFHYSILFVVCHWTWHLNFRISFILVFSSRNSHLMLMATWVTNNCCNCSSSDHRHDWTRSCSCPAGIRNPCFGLRNNRPFHTRSTSSVHHFLYNEISRCSRGHTFTDNSTYHQIRHIHHFRCQIQYCSWDSIHCSCSC